jgi:hypothetical protein
VHASELRQAVNQGTAVFSDASGACVRASEAPGVTYFTAGAAVPWDKYPALTLSPAAVR